MRDLFAPAAAPAEPPQNEGGREVNDDPNKDRPAQAHILRPKQIERRVISEMNLENLLPWHFKPGDAYHLFSFGNVDSIAYIRAILKQQPLEYLVCQTFYISTSHIGQLRSWIEKGLIGRLDFYLCGRRIPVQVYRHLPGAERSGGPNRRACGHTPQPCQGYGRIRLAVRLRGRRLGKLQRKPAKRADVYHHRQRTGTIL